MICWREAIEADLAPVLALLSDDRRDADPQPMAPEVALALWREMGAQGVTRLIVGTDDAGQIVATYQLSILTGLSLAAPRRAQIEAVRVAAGLRGQGIGAALMADAEARARAAGAVVMQLTTHVSRTRAHAFYKRLGFTRSHFGYKRKLD
ncbi:hypothetical protein SDC9_18827 [bioreactor metagenome]|uniref:N-acetyltransferase domain-containing protein n=1 Tax=bioreactor metagenome TaxID=1076179 RepID=A0A644U1C3_9ZZZZ